MYALIVVPDESLGGTIATYISAKSEYQCGSTTTAEQAVKLLSDLPQPPGLLIIQLDMSPADAEPVVAAARGKNPRLPVLLIGGSFDARDSTRVRDMKALFWITGDITTLLAHIAATKTLIAELP